MRLQFVFFGLLYTGLFLSVWDIYVGASMCLMYCLNFFPGPFLNPPLVTDQLARLRQRFQEQLGKDSFRRQDNCMKHFYALASSILFQSVARVISGMLMDMGSGACSHDMELTGWSWS